MLKTHIPRGLTPGYREIGEVKASINKLKQNVNYLQNYTTANKIIREVVTALALGIIQPVSNDLLRDLDNNYKEAVNFYKQRHLFTPFFIRIKNIVCVFDVSHSPGVIERLCQMIEQGLLFPEPEKVTEFKRKYPDNALVPYEGQRPLEVWLQDKVYVFDTDNWNRRVSYEFLTSLALFNDKAEWK